MIKEKKKNVQKKKSLYHTIMEYVRTVCISFLCAVVITTFLAIHARNEMIRNLYTNIEEQQKMEEILARQLVMQSDLIKDLKNKKYSICIQVGNLYSASHDYKNAQVAYEFALDKARTGVYTPYYKLAGALIAQEKFKEAENIIKSVNDVNNKSLIKFKTRSYIEMGDKYYSIGKFLSAAKSYEKAKFYYDRFTKKDKIVEDSIILRIVNAYIEAADVMVKSGYNSEAVRFLKKAEKYEPDNFNIKYKLAIIYSDLDPVQSVKYFEPLLDKMPQHIDYGTYAKALMKAANIADLEGKPTEAKYYRYKIHSIDIFVNQKVIYKNDIEVILDSFIVKKFWFKYKLKLKYRFKNISNTDIIRLSADFNLKQNDKLLETISKNIVNRDKPLFSNGGETAEVEVTFGKNIFTRKELEEDYIDIYLYKDERYKTEVASIKIPKKSIYSSK